MEAAEIILSIKSELQDYHNKTQHLLNNGIKTEIGDIKEKIEILPVLTTNVNHLTKNMEELTKVVKDINISNIERDKDLTKINLILKAYTWLTGIIITAVVGLWVLKLFT